MDHTLFTITVVLSLITGTAACILSILTFEILRRSPFGRAVIVLSLIMIVFVVYHVTLLISPGRVALSETVRSLLYTGSALFVWVTVWSQYRVRRGERRDVRSS